MTSITIYTEYITLGQFLKFVNLASGGGDVKALLATAQIFVNDEVEHRRGRKCRPGDRIRVNDEAWCIQPCP